MTTHGEQTPEQWVAWFLGLTFGDQVIAAWAVGQNKIITWECLSEAHKRYLRECREQHGGKERG